MICLKPMQKACRHILPLAVTWRVKGIHALSNRNCKPIAKKLLCYYCQKSGHFAQDCSHKLAGLPAVKRDFGSMQVFVVGDDSDPSDPGCDFGEEINALRNCHRVSFRDLPRGPRNKPWQYNRRSVSQIAPEETSGKEDEQFEDCESSPQSETQEGDSRASSGGSHTTPPTA